MGKVHEGSQVFVMKNNKVRLIENGGGIVDNLKSRNRLIRLYNRVRKSGGWREVARQRGSKNAQYIYNFAMHGKEPPYSNPSERKACYLSVAKKRIATNKEPLPEWLRKIKKNISGMAKDTRKSLGLEKTK